MSRTEDELIADLQSWLRDYYHEDILELAQHYPNERRHLTIDWHDILAFDRKFAEDFLKAPEETRDYLEWAVAVYDIPIDVDFSNVGVRVVNLNEADIYSPIEITQDQPEGYIGVRGDLHKVTTPSPEVQVAAWECQNPKCGHTTKLEVYGDELPRPDECNGCGMRGTYQFDKPNSEFVHFCKVRVQTPPDQSGELQAEHIDGEARGDLVWYGHDVGLAGRVGDGVTVYGTVEYRQRNGNGENELLFDEYLDVDAVEFDTDQDDVDIQAHRKEFERLAESDDPVRTWKESLVPGLYATDEWDVGLEMLVTYLFSSPRISIPEGPTIRGDIHFLIITDFGMGKSMVNNAVAMFSPQVIKESVTGMSSDVGLLAAAVEDDFGGGQWTLQPGILVRGNGGHVILDEIDKTDADLERMNDALEGEQVVDINKAGQSATYKSRVGLLATGNPEKSRFERHTPISEQLDIDQSLLSRFDGILTMQDIADEEQDRNVAGTAGESFVEAFEYQFGDRKELDKLDRVISPAVGRAWVAYARENVHPMPKRKHVQRVQDWYAEDARQLNQKFNDNSEEGADMPVPVNARVIEAVLRRAVAYARVHLREEVADEDVERSIRVQKTLIGQQFDGEKFVPEEARRSRKPDCQKDEYDELVNTVESLEGNEPAHVGTVIEEAEDRGVTRVEHKIEKLKNQGRLYEPQTDCLRTT